MAVAAVGERGDRVVVGVDGSPQSLAALRWAYGQAELTGRALVVVGAWGFPVYVSPPQHWPIDVDPEAVVRHQLDRAIMRVLPPRGTVGVFVVIRRASPARALLEESEGADLLVLGARGGADPAELVFGSVSMRCVANARCPVVLVPAG